MSDNEEKSGLSIGWIIFWIVLAAIILGSMRNGGDSAGCENWISDPRGGYCE